MGKSKGSCSIYTNKVEFWLCFAYFPNWGPITIRLTAYNARLFQIMTLLAFAGHSILFNLHWRSQEGALYSLGLYKHLSKEWSVVIVGLFQQNLDVKHANI